MAAQQVGKFETGLRKATRQVAKTVHPSLNLLPSTVKILNRILTAFNDLLVEECRKLHKPKKKGDNFMREDVAQRTVEKLMRGQLRSLAIANAHRTLALYASGVLEYTPRAVKAKKKKGKVPEEYMKCVAPMSKMQDPNAKLAKEAKEAIAEMIFKMSKALVGKAQELAAEKDELTADEIIKGVDFFMKPNMAKHAIAEGQKNTVKFMCDCHYYSQQQFASKI